MITPTGYRPLVYGELITEDVMYYGASRFVSIKKFMKYVGIRYTSAFCTMYVPAVTPAGNVICNEL